MQHNLTQCNAHSEIEADPVALRQRERRESIFMLHHGKEIDKVGSDLSSRDYFPNG